MTSVTLANATDSYGVKRTDTGTTIVADGTPIPNVSEGSYSYDITDPTTGLTYEISVQVVYEGTTYEFVRTNAAASSITYYFLIPTDTEISSEAEVIRWLGERAAAIMTEDWNNEDNSPVWSEILGMTRDKIEISVNQFYDMDDLLTVPYIRRMATVIAAHYLSMRRGNPGLLVAMVNQIEDTLELIRAGKVYIPGARRLGHYGPIVRNYQTQPYRKFVQRPIKTKSTGDEYRGVKYSFEPYFYEC